MGGAMGVHDTEEFPWLEDERRWIAAAVSSDVPVLGVCLGAQQLAAALGASVRTGPGPEIGVGAVALTPRAGPIPCSGPKASAWPSIHWHGDTFDVPAGAVRLATGDRYPNQAFRYGRAVYGLQFHIEVDDAMAEAWAPELPAEVSLVVEDRRVVEAVGRRASCVDSSRWSPRPEPAVIPSAGRRRVAR